MTQSQSPTSKTFYLLVTCCVENSRYTILKKVINNLINKQGFSQGLENHLYVFDNGSTIPGTIDLLKTSFPNSSIYVADKNLGFWSAINWSLNNIDLTGYDFIHVIESDLFYYENLSVFGEVEEFLINNEDFGGVRLQEYSVKNSDLYNKSLQLPHAKKYAWVSHVNSFTREPVKLEPTENPKFHKSNFLTKLPSFNRIKPFIEVFKEIGLNNKFSEPDFQHKFYQRYPIIGVLDGGLYHAKLGFTLDDPSALSGSWSHDVSSLGYRSTRNDIISKFDNVRQL